MQKMRPQLITYFFVWCVAMMTSSVFGQSTSISTDFSFLQKYPVIAVGESSHGSKTDWLLREKVMDDLLLHTDSLDVFVEMPFYAGIAIERYANGEIDSAQLMAEVKYYGLCTDGFFHLVDRYKHDERVTFYGFDMQTHEATLDYLTTELSKQLPESEKKIAEIKQTLNHNYLDRYTPEQYASRRDKVLAAMKELQTIVGVNDSLLHDQFLQIKFPLTILRQYVEYVDQYKLQTKKKFFYSTHFRDSCMAENISALQAYSGKQAVVLAANFHVNKAGENNGRWVYMGGRLSRKFGEDYFVLVTQYEKGDLLEVEVEKGKRKIVTNPMKTTRKSLSGYLSEELNNKPDTLILVEAENEKWQTFIHKKVWYQDFGVGPSDKKSYLMGVPAEEFDGIYFIHNVEPSVYLRSQPE